MLPGIRNDFEVAPVLLCPVDEVECFVTAVAAATAVDDDAAKDDMADMLGTWP